MNDEDHVLLSEKLEDQLKAVEWAHEQKKILDDKSRRIADALMEKMTPLIMKNSVQNSVGTIWVHQKCNYINNIQNRIKIIWFCNIITADLCEKLNPEKSLNNGLKCRKPVFMRVSGICFIKRL